MKLYIYSTFMCLLNTYYGQRIVENCPLDITSWNTRSIFLDCEKGLEYHCILTYNATLFEVCIERKIYEAHRIGCPWIQFHNNEPIFGAKNSKCPDDLKGCPPKEHRGYGSDQLYLYPMCLVPEKDRLQNRGNVTFYNERVTQTTTRHEYSHFLTKEQSVIFATTCFLQLMCTIVTIIFFAKRKYARRGDPEQDEDAMIHQRENSENRSKYNYVWHCDLGMSSKPRVQNPVGPGTENEVSLYSDTRRITFKCMDKFTLQNEIKLFKETESINTNDDDSESTSLIGETDKGINELRRTLDRFQKTIAVFINVNTSTAEEVGEFSRFLLKHCCVNYCIAYSIDKDVLTHTKEALYKRVTTIHIHGDLDDLKRFEDEYAMVDDVYELTSTDGNPIVHHSTNYCNITPQTVSVPDKSVLCNISHHSF